MELRQNVVLLRDPVDPTDSFHPRFNLMHTSSFKELPSAWKVGSGSMTSLLSLSLSPSLFLSS